MSKAFQMRHCTKRLPFAFKVSFDCTNGKASERQLYLSPDRGDGTAGQLQKLNRHESMNSGPISHWALAAGSSCW
jgi:hypothetical protein